MTAFNDPDGLTSIKALKLDGATKYIGTSSSVVGIDTTANCAALFSFTNWSANSIAVIDCNESTAANIAKTVAQIVDVLAAQGMCTRTYNGS